MSGAGMVWARGRTVGNPTAKALLMLIGELSDDTGGCYRDQRYMANILEVSRETVVRNLAKLEAAGFISREARFTSDKRRMTDKISLCMERSFVVDNPPEEPCDPESHGPESHVTLTQEPCDSDAPTHVTQDHTKRETTNKLKKQTTNTAPALFETPNAVDNVHSSKALVSTNDTPSHLIAKTLYDETKGALPFMAMKSMADWARKNWPEKDWREIGMTMRQLHQNQRAVTKANMQRALDGIAAPGQAPARSTTNDRVMQALSLKEKYAAKEAASNGR